MTAFTMSMGPVVPTTWRPMTFFPIVPPMRPSCKIQYRIAMKPITRAPSPTKRPPNPPQNGPMTSTMMSETTKTMIESMMYATIRLIQWSCRALFDPMMFSPFTTVSPPDARSIGAPPIKVGVMVCTTLFRGRARGSFPGGRELLLHALRAVQELAGDDLREVHGLARLHDHVAARARALRVDLEDHR